jgi:Tfp pilus assembly protein PilE
MPRKKALQYLLVPKLALISLPSYWNMSTDSIAAWASSTLSYVMYAAEEFFEDFLFGGSSEA